MTEQRRSLNLVSHHLCPYVQRALIALAEKGVPHERTYIDLSDKPGWFKRISPLGRVPLLLVDGAVLFESAVIVDYLDETTPHPLHPRDPLAKAMHRSWVEFASAVLSDIGGFYAAPDAAGFEQKRRTLAARFGTLEAALNGNPWFGGPDFSLVDAAFAPVFRYFDVFDRIGDFGVLADLPKAAAWRRALLERPSVRNAVAADYPDRLKSFLKQRNSHLSTLIH